MANMERGEEGGVGVQFYDKNAVSNDSIILLSL